MKRTTVTNGILLLEKQIDCSQTWPSVTLPKMLLLVRVQGHSVSLTVFWETAPCTAKI